MRNGGVRTCWRVVAAKMAGSPEQFIYEIRIALTQDRICRKFNVLNQDFFSRVAFRKFHTYVILVKFFFALPLTLKKCEIKLN